MEKLRNGATRVTYKYYDPNTSSYTTATQSTHYDDDGRMLSTTDSQSRTISYDLLRQLSTYTAPQPSSRTVTYTYNALGQKTSTGYGGFTINYHYFANGWLKDVKKGLSDIASYTYDSSGNRTRVDFGNLTYQTFDYDSDPRYRLASIDYAYGCDGDEDIEVRGTLDVTRDNGGNPLTWGNDDYKKTYTYDDNNRLATAALPGDSTATYLYDWVGNRLGTGYTYNAADQMTASPNKTYTYDGNGNMLTGTMNFGYTPTNLVSTAGGTSMAWDSMGNRVGFTTSGSATYQFVYDPSAGIPAVLEEVTPGGSVYYIREPSGALIARITGTGESQVTTYYHFDELGSTLFLTDSSGILTDKYTYDAWGNVTSWVGETQQPYQFVGQLGYYTHTQESGFKLLQLGVRLYDPEMGRFLQRDPADATQNAYGYADLQPMSQVDPDGQIPKLVEEWRKCADGAIGNYTWPKDYGWPKGLNKKNACKGLTDRQCWNKIVRCVIWAESTDDPDAVNKGSGTSGLMQIAPICFKKCADHLGISEKKFNPFDPCTNIRCGVYKLWSCAMHGGLRNCKTGKTFTSIGGPGTKFGQCMLGK